MKKLSVLVGGVLFIAFSYAGAQTHAYVHDDPSHREYVSARPVHAEAYAVPAVDIAPGAHQSYGHDAIVREPHQTFPQGLAHGREHESRRHEAYPRHPRGH